MANKRIRAYWLLLLTVLYTGCLVLSVGEAQARYVNTASWSTMLQQSQTGFTSDCMVDKNGAPMTVLVGQISIETPTDIGFWLKSTGNGEPEGKLIWKIAEEDYIQYLKVEMTAGADVLENGTNIQLIDGYAMYFNMTLTPTENARTVAHNDLLIHIVVGWGDNMRGVFQVQLPASVPEGSLPEETEPEETQPEETQPEETEPEETEPEATEPETTEPEETEPEETQPEQTRPEETVPEETSEEIQPEETIPQVTESEENPPVNNPEDSEQTEPTEPTQPHETEPSQTETEETEPAGTEPEETVTEPAETTEPTEETQSPEETTAPTEPEETELIPTDPIVKLDTVSNFDPKALLPIRLSATGGITTVYLGIGSLDEKGVAGEMEPFPDMTRFSVDGGESYYLMYRGHMVELNMSVPVTTVLLDFSMVEIPEELYLFAEGYNSQGSFISSCAATTVPDVDTAFPVETYELNPSPEPVTEEDEEPEETEPTEEPEETRPEPTILNQNNYLEITFPENWTEYTLDYSIELLTLTDGKLEYKQAETVPAEKKQSGGLVAEYVNELDKEGKPIHKLVLLTGKNLPQAGTYRVNMSWSYQGICFTETQTTFFINYTASGITAG